MRHSARCRVHALASHMIKEKTLAVYPCKCSVVFKAGVMPKDEGSNADDHAHNAHRQEHKAPALHV